MGYQSLYRYLFTCDKCKKKKNIWYKLPNTVYPEPPSGWRRMEQLKPGNSMSDVLEFCEECFKELEPNLACLHLFHSKKGV